MPSVTRSSNTSLGNPQSESGRSDQCLQGRALPSPVLRRPVVFLTSRLGQWLAHGTGPHLHSAGRPQAERASLRFPNPALRDLVLRKRESAPPRFNVLFYQKDIGGEFKLYSPYMDGPDKLTTSVMAVNDRKKAFDLIDKQLGREVARTTLSLVPGEPVDIDSAESSLGSDVTLSVIRNLPNNPFTKDSDRSQC